MHAAFADPVPEIDCDGRRRASPEGVVNRVCRVLVGAWLRSIERRTEAALRQLDHADLLEEFEASRRD
jgi:hypothetical protein